MTDITQLIQSGSAHVWLYIPVAILLGALHGLEPGHSKTMMAAFIIAIRGTVWQAVLLGLSAAISHSLLIWLLAALALYYGSQWNAENLEPYLQIVSAVMIFGLAVWMYFRTRREIGEAHGHAHRHSHDGHEHQHAHGHDDHDHHHDHGHAHGHEHHSHAPLLKTATEVVTPAGLILPAGSAHLATGNLIIPAENAAASNRSNVGSHGGMMLDTGHGWLEIAVFETGVPPRFRIYPCKGSGQPVPLSKGVTMRIETTRMNGSSQHFLFEPGNGFWEATAELPEPHEFMATVTMSHGDHTHTYKLRFTEDHHHHGAVAEVIQPENDVYQDAHERAHAEDIAKRFANRAVTTPQIVLFGITGGLMPCPAAFTILLVCLQLKRVALGLTIVGAFSFGLALTMVTVGAVAAWSVQHAEKRFSGFSEAMRKAPYVSCALLTLLALFMAWSGWHGLHVHHQGSIP